MENPTTIDTVQLPKSGLVTDVNTSFISKGQYSFARNTVRNSRDGDIGTVGNEPSNILSFNAPYPILGIINLPDGTHLVFSGDEVNSEIGIGDSKRSIYKTIKNLKDFKFSKFNQPITGVAKKDFSKGVIVTFSDRENPIRRIELNTLSKLTNVDDILLFKKISYPNIIVSRGNTGNMPNGVYSVAIAYSLNNEIFTDWFSLTNRNQLFSLVGNNSLNIRLENIDQNFKEFSVAVIGNYIDPTTKGATKLAKIIGTYSVTTKSIDITDFINSTYTDIKISDIINKRNTWQKAGIVTSNSNYLLLADLVSRPEENYQLKAFDIKAEYYVEQVLASYYDEEGQDISYYRDENYDFYIQGIYTTGESTDKFHIGGRLKTPKDKELAVEEVIEYDQECFDKKKLEKWQTSNTAGGLKQLNNKFVCNRRVLGKGSLGYFESTELYPNNPVYGTNANTPIRYHKFPDEAIVPRYSFINGKYYINILGIKFSNIPRFDSPDIIGYKITRSDRKGGNGTIVARGLMTNTRGYFDRQAAQQVLYTNYTVNDLRPDVYLSSTQTNFMNGTERDFTPLTTVYKDKFNFYSPHTMFQPKYSLGTEVKIETEEYADVAGNFEKVYNHPRLKLMNQFTFWVSLAIGTIETYFEAQGLKNSTQVNTTGSVKGVATTTGTANGTINFLAGPTGVKTSSDSVSQGSNSALSITGQSAKNAINSLISAIKGGTSAEKISHIKVIKDTLKAIVSLGVTAALSVVSIMRYANEVFQTISNFTGYTDYVYQYNAIAKFTTCKSLNKRRNLSRSPLYIPSDIVTIDNTVYNNYFREATVYLELQKELEFPSVEDTSRNTISGFGLCSDITKHTTSKGSAYYVTSKVANPNQYGRLGSSSPVSMHSQALVGESTPILYGGDCIITKFRFQKKMQFFNQNMANANFPDGTEYDYNLYRNIAYPRYWLDSTSYDFSQLLNKKLVNFSTFSRTTAGKHNLDCKKNNDGKVISRIDDAYMYLSNNCAVEFFVEADFNSNFREKTKEPSYSDQNNNISQIFRSDKLENREEYEINRVYSDIYSTEIYALQQRHDFNPLDPTPTTQENSVIYSLPSYNLQYVDNWQYFLPANYFAFRESDFGTLTSINKLDQDRLIFLFSKASPFVSMGRDFLQLEGTGRKISIGDGGLFAQDPREIMPTDNNYGSSTSRFAFSNTHLGRYYPSQTQGRIMSFGEGLEDITRQGVAYWCKNYMPIRLYEYFPEYPQAENTVSGVGYLTVFDSFNETIYITKRDFSPIYKEIVYENKKFNYKGQTILLRDSRYFNDISWTISYSPTEKSFTSWHDWHPELTIQTENHFLTVKDKGVWKHNEAIDSFCKFYDKNYPFEVEFVSTSGQQVEIIRSLQYILEAYKYKNSGRDRFHLHHENFDRLLVHNTEQISPILNLNYGSNDPEQDISFPKKDSKTNVSWDVLFFKEENKYTVNQFWDAVKDRGEFDKNEFHLYPTDQSGYKSVINPIAIDINKPEEERKKFRHYWNKFRLSKTVSNDVKFIVKLLNIKKISSIR